MKYVPYFWSIRKFNLKDFSVENLANESFSVLQVEWYF